MKDNAYCGWMGFIFLNLSIIFIVLGIELEYNWFYWQAAITVFCSIIFYIGFILNVIYEV